MSTLTPTQAMATFKVYKCSGTQVNARGSTLGIVSQHIIAPSPEEALAVFHSYYNAINSSWIEVPILQVPAGCSVLSASGRHHFVS